MLIESLCGTVRQWIIHEDCIRRNRKEETGYKIKDVRKSFEAYILLDRVTEILYFLLLLIQKMKVTEGGGIEHGEENIEVLKIDINKAMAMIETGQIKDGKIIMLCSMLN